MHTVNFILKNNPNSLTLVFKAHKAAEDAYKKVIHSIEKVELADDYGLKLLINMSDVASVSFGEYEQDMEKNMDLQIIQHKAQLKAQNKAKNDAGLRLLEQSAQPLIKSN